MKIDFLPWDILNLILSTKTDNMPDESFQFLLIFRSTWYKIRYRDY